MHASCPLVIFETSMLFSHHTKLLYHHTYVSEEFSLMRRRDMMLQDSGILLLVQCARTLDMAWHRSIESVEAMASDLGHDEQERDSKATCSKSPEQTAEGSCNKCALRS